MGKFLEGYSHGVALIFPSRGRLWTVQTVSPYRPSSVTPNGVPLRNGMTATGSHEYFYSLRGAQPPGEGDFLLRNR